MQINDETLAKLRAEPISATLLLVREALEELNLDQDDGEWRESEYLLLIDIGTLLTEMQSAGLLPVRLQQPPILGDIVDDCRNHVAFLQATEAQLQRLSVTARVEGIRSRFKAGLTNAFAYQFSGGDLARIQDLINELRDRIEKQDGLEEDHRRRLLGRLEKLQTELHKKMSDLDRFWGLIGDAGVVLGKLGNDAKPIVDRIREIADIVWSTQSRAEELPSGTKPPLIEHRPSTPDEDEPPEA